MGQPSVRILLAATAALYISTCVYFGFTQSLYRAISKTTSDAASNLFNPEVSSVTDGFIRVLELSIIQMGATAATLTVNVRLSGRSLAPHVNAADSFHFPSQMLISDMIVWWRALVIWPGNKLVWGTGIVLIATTGGMYSMLKFFAVRVSD